MATFDPQKFFQISSGFGESTSKHLFSYNDTETDIAELKADGFFTPDVPGGLYDLIYIVGKDDRELVYVSEVDPEVKVVDIVTASSGTVPDGSITTAKLADGAVTTAKLADDAVEGDKIKDRGIPEGKVAIGSIDYQDLKNGACSGPKIADLGVSAGCYAVGSIATEDIADSAITDAKLDSTFLKLVGSDTASATAAASTEYTISGATTATDFVFAQVIGGFNTGVRGAVVSAADKVTVHWDGTGNASDTVLLIVFRST